MASYEEQRAISRKNYDFGYAQGLAYAWGRIDAGERALRGWESNFAAYWAEIYSAEGVRLAEALRIGAAFEDWQCGVARTARKV